ncbi:hypothetical protein KC19_11G014400 [Ceratodon purpureus]|uniref:Dynein assembly factor 1, axonemal homolog n=2 Tax=Ceratodon purpureus TaxID=3225 RepID=A0A8T0GD06_CERPU|nr:hypothetical protein KC19_11G014400 [Ceratodon purpureus]
MDNERFEMTPKSLKDLCKSRKLYTSCPELNEVIHLHQKGIQNIQNLDEYTGLRTIYLECNAISKMENLEPLVNLRCLYLNQNLVEVVEGLETLKYLEIIDLADNMIRSVAGLASCPELRQLNLSGNKIRTSEDIIHLQGCKALQLLDLANNKIDDEEALEVIHNIPLQLLRLCGNPIVSIAKHYRKLTVFAMPTLNYLDESPVFEKERRLAVAFTKGGIEAEKEELKEFKKEQAETREKNRKAFYDLIDSEDQLHEPSVSSDVDNRIYEILEKDAKERDKLQLEYVVDETCVSLSDPSIPLDAKKRGLNQLNVDDKVGESPPKQLKMSFDSKDEMDVEGVFGLDVEGRLDVVARDLMDLDCGDVPTLDMQECTHRTHNQPLEAEYNHFKDDNIEVQTNMVTSTFEESFDASTNPWLQLAPEELRESVEQERIYKKNLQEKILQKAAMDAEETLESKKRFMPSFSKATKEEIDTPCVKSRRPIIWGSKIYRGLWSKAATINDNNVESDTNSTNSMVVSVPAITSDDVLINLNNNEVCMEQVSMMDVNTCLLPS